MLTPDLLPCPFCGSTNIGEPLRRRPLQVACIDCGAEGPEAHTVDEARTMWNTHATALTPGLPKGWGAYNKHVSDSLTTHSVYGPTNHSYVMLHVRDDGTVRWDTDGQRYAPPAVYAYLLARAGVVS